MLLVRYSHCLVPHCSHVILKNACVDDLSTVVDKGSKNGFAEEFDHLHSYQCKVLHSRKEGIKPANQSKTVIQI